MRTGHPSEVIEKLAHDYGGEIILQFGIYTYVPQTFEDRRTVHDVHFRKMEPWYNNACQELTRSQEIALQSTILVGKKKTIMHIPMVDFLESATLDDLREAVRTLQEHGLNEFFAYDSGRSFHLYCLPLIQAGAIYPFFGRLLLLKGSELLPTVDPRWIGHRLIAGYAALRWTANTPNHQKEPARIVL